MDQQQHHSEEHQSTEQQQQLNSDMDSTLDMPACDTEPEYCVYDDTSYPDGSPVLCLKALPGVDVFLRDGTDDVYVRVGGRQHDGVWSSVDVTLDEYRRFTQGELLANVYSAVDEMQAAVEKYIPGGCGGESARHIRHMRKVVDRELGVVVNLYNALNVVVLLNRDNAEEGSRQNRCAMTMDRFQHLVWTSSNVEWLAELLLTRYV